MDYKIRIRNKALKELKKLPARVTLRIVAAIDGLVSEPRPDGSKKLKGSAEDLYRIRIGNYRVIYAIDEDIQIIDIRKIAHRKDVYDFR